jgi:hypothetical protein
MPEIFAARPPGPFSPPQTAPIYQTVLIPDPHNPGQYIEVTGMIKVGSIPIVAHGPVPAQPPRGVENTPFPHRRNGSDALSPLKDMTNVQANIQNRKSIPSNSRLRIWQTWNFRSSKY